MDEKEFHADYSKVNLDQPNHRMLVELDNIEQRLLHDKLTLEELMNENDDLDRVSTYAQLKKLKENNKENLESLKSVRKNYEQWLYHTSGK